jgi:hypothetical protein
MATRFGGATAHHSTGVQLWVTFGSGNTRNMRGVFMALFLLLGVHAVSALMSPAAVCSDACDDDDDSGQCPPSCVDCACCLHTTPVVNVRARLVAPFVAEFDHCFSDPPALRSAEPRAILHVPIQRLA